MSNLSVVLMILILLLSLVGGYYHLQVWGALKEGYRSSIWSGRWLFHPEWLDEGGRLYRKKFLYVLLLGVILVVIFYFSWVQQV